MNLLIKAQHILSHFDTSLKMDINRVYKQELYTLISVVGLDTQYRSWWYACNDIHPLVVGLGISFCCGEYYVYIYTGYIVTVH